MLLMATELMFVKSKINQRQEMMVKVYKGQVLWKGLLEGLV